MIEGVSFYSFSGYGGFENYFLGLPKSNEVHAEVFPIGESVEGRTIHCLRLGGGGKPGAMYVSLVHGVEFIGGDMSLAVMRWFLDGKNREKVENILSGCSVYFVPVVNPDGYEKAARQRESFGVAFVRKNASGVDLNRNYSVGFDAKGRGLWAGMPFRFMPVYRGPRAFSEPETRAIRNLVEAEPIRTSISFHSFGRMIGYPYCFTKEKCKDHDLLLQIALGMRARQKLVKYRVMQEYDYVPTSGDMNDWLYEEGGVLPFIMELNRFGLVPGRMDTWLNPFAWSNMPNAEQEIANNLPAVLYLAEWTAENF
ncbi:MAG: M14 family zinc carboxypeptidase [bacterium]